MNKKINPSLVKMVNILSDGEYHDGTTIGEKLRMTRSAVWKLMQKLMSHNIKIDSIKGKGYSLLEPLVLLDTNKIKKNISRDVSLAVFESVTSTNDYLKKFKHHHGVQLCLAEQQTKGKGRFNREWVSPFGKNIYMSCLYPFQKDISELSGLSLVVSLAVVETLKKFGVTKELAVKWPNDVMYENQKLSGILIEIQAETHGACQVVIGVGVNVNMLSEASENITQSWTSLQKILGVYVDRNLFCVSLINNLLEYLQKFAREGLPAFVDEWNAVDGLMGKKIAIKNLNHSVKGKVLGINERGCLLLEVEDGKIRAFSSGETSIVKKNTV